MATKIVVGIGQVFLEDVFVDNDIEAFTVELWDEDTGRSAVLYESHDDINEMTPGKFLEQYDMAMNMAYLWNKNLNLDVVRADSVMEAAEDVDEELPDTLQKLERMV